MPMRTFIFKWCAGFVLGAGALGLFPANASAGDMKLQATLVWGTNDDKSPDPSHKPVDAEIAKKLKAFKWSHYFEICSKEVSVVRNGEARVPMSKDCEITVKNLGKGQVEVTLVGKGKVVGTIKQKLPKGETLVTGGNATNSTGWFIVIKQVD